MTQQENISKITTQLQTVEDNFQYLDSKVKNKVDKVTGKGLSTNDYTTTEKNKLAGLSNYDDTDIRSRISSLQDSVNSIGEIPTKTSDLTNDSGFQTATQVSNSIATAIAGAQHLKKTLVDSLPVTGEDNIIYLVPATNSKNQNVKDEYMWINNAWEKVGSSEVDLTNYYNKTQIDQYIADCFNVTITALGD